MSAHRPVPNALMNDVIDIAYHAADDILRIYQQGFNITTKEDQSPLTEADLAAHQTIVNGLQKLTPDIPVLSEESTSIPYATRSSWQRYWLVDPLDGTREFIKRNDEFTVNIALIEGQKSVLGVIVVPCTQDCYYAAQHQGAWKKTGSNENKISCRAWEGGKLIIAGSRSHYKPQFNRFVDTLENYEVQYIGSSLKACLIAEGKLDVYPRFGPTSEWDTAAAQIIVEEANGSLCDHGMQALRYNTKESLLNPPFIVCGLSDINWLKKLAYAETSGSQTERC